MRRGGFGQICLVIGWAGTLKAVHLDLSHMIGRDCHLDQSYGKDLGEPLWGYRPCMVPMRHSSTCVHSVRVQGFAGFSWIIMWWRTLWSRVHWPTGHPRVDWVDYYCYGVGTIRYNNHDNMWPVMREGRPTSRRLCYKNYYFWYHLKCNNYITKFKMLKISLNKNYYETWRTQLSNLFFSYFDPNALVYYKLGFMWQNGRQCQLRKGQTQLRNNENKKADVNALTEKRLVYPVLSPHWIFIMHQLRLLSLPQEK